MADNTIELLSLALDINQAKHKVAANNIASADIEGANKLEANFEALLRDLSAKSPTQQSSYVQSLKSDWNDYLSNSTIVKNEPIKLDEEVADALLASGKYKAIAEGLNRKLGILNLAVKGGKR